jgi:hypothetical protein
MVEMWEPILKVVVLVEAGVEGHIDDAEYVHTCYWS